MTVIGLQNVHFPARNIGRLADFWQNAVGLSLIFRDEDRWVQFKAGQGKFAIASPEEAHPGQTGGVPVFEVDDLAHHMAAITAHGGQLLADRDMGDHGRVITFSDPDGNIAQFFSRARTV
jgi:predicted enzyme related to lactoylglutathione lyase